MQNARSNLIQMKIALAQILNPAVVDRNTMKFNVNVAGRPTLSEVTLTRSLHGFEVRFEVRIDGILWHSNTATLEDRELFDKVWEAAVKLQDEASEAKRDDARKVANVLFSRE